MTEKIVRLLEADIHGETPIFMALRRIKGVNFMLSSAVCNIAGIPRDKKIGLLEEKELEKIKDIIEKPKDYSIPDWLLNRRRDLETGETKHLTSSKLKLQHELDIKMLRKIKCYRGVRHGIGLPLRGQRTKAHFRSGRALGVNKKKARMGGKE